MNSTPVVFVSGCFDTLHEGHRHFLKFASGLGNWLIVSVASDQTIRELKREPIFCEHSRWEAVNELPYVDECFINRGTHDNYDFLPYLKNYKPDIWVVDDNNKNLEEKQKIAYDLGIKIVLFNKPAGEYDSSTTKIIQKCQNSQ